MRVGGIGTPADTYTHTEHTVVHEKHQVKNQLWIVLKKYSGAKSFIAVSSALRIAGCPCRPAHGMCAAYLVCGVEELLQNIFRECLAQLRA